MLAEKYAYLEDTASVVEPLRREPQPSRQKEPTRQEETRQVPVRRHQTLHRVLTIGLVMVCFASACFIVFRYALISDSHRAILVLEQALEQESIRKEKLEVELSYSRDLNTIQFSATEMGMKYPAEGQIKYVDLPKTEAQMEQADAFAEQSRPSLWSRFLGFSN